MPQPDNQAEPSMEEILASIRRIISEDDAGGPAPAPEPVLELSEPAPPPPPKPAPPEPPPQAAAAAPVEEDDLLVFDQEEPEPVYEAPRPTYESAAARAETIISDTAVSAAAQSFTRLAGSIRLTEIQGQTLEGMVRELLRPMLRDWLDSNLPTIVEAMVEAELDRISRIAR